MEYPYEQRYLIRLIRYSFVMVHCIVCGLDIFALCYKIFVLFLETKFSIFVLLLSWLSNWVDVIVYYLYLVFQEYLKLLVWTLSVVLERTLLLWFLQVCHTFGLNFMYCFGTNYVVLHYELWNVALILGRFKENCFQSRYCVISLRYVLYKLNMQ